MTWEERLFLALGEADESLLHRSQHPARRRLWLPLAAAAACLVLVAAGLLYLRQDVRPPAPVTPGTAETPVQTLYLSGGNVGSFTLHQLRWDTDTSADFILYVDETHYRQTLKDGVYTIEPLADMSGLPLCSLEISHQVGITVEDAAALAAETLRASYATVSEPANASIIEGLLVTGSNGTAWDDTQAEVYLVGDRQGGVFILVSRYFLEAAEGHGSRFADMISTFQPVTAEDVGPAWLTELRSLGDQLIPAIFSNDLASVADALAENALIDLPPEAGLSVSAIDYTTDSDQIPTSAAISVRFRQLEDSYDYLTIELSYTEGRWLVTAILLEK